MWISERSLFAQPYNLDEENSMTNSLEGKVAIVTGGGSGIGAEIASEFVAAGAQVIITGRRQAMLDAVANKIGNACTSVQMDVSKAADVKRLFDAVREQHGRLDIIVANAGAGDNAPLGEITEAQFDRVVGTNLKGVLLTVQGGLPLMQAGASVIIIGSTASARTPPHMSLYGATKAGVSSFVRTWMLDTKGKGIRFNVLSPGMINTESLRGALETGADDANIKALAAHIPLERIGEPKEVAQVAVFFASDAASYVNGVELYIDGGYKA